MTIGMVVECEDDGMDQQVCLYLAMLLLPGSSKDDFNFTCLGTKSDDGRGGKGRLFQEIGPVVERLLNASHCDKVLVIFDRVPREIIEEEVDDPQNPGSKKRVERRMTRQEECDTMKRLITGAGGDLSKVSLICITEMLETWLICDRDAVEAFAPPPRAHPMTFEVPSNLERVQKPHIHLSTYLKNARKGLRYCKKTHAIKIVAKMDPGLGSLRRICSFQRFESKLTGRPLRG